MRAEQASQPNVSQKVIEGLRPVVQTMGLTSSGYYSERRGYGLARQGYVSGILPHLTVKNDDRSYVASFFQRIPVSERPLVMTADDSSMLQLRYGLLPGAYGQEAIDGLKAILSGTNLGNPDIQRFRTPMKEIAEMLHTTFGDEVTRKVLDEALIIRTTGKIGADSDREVLRGILARMTGPTDPSSRLGAVLKGLRNL